MSLKWNACAGVASCSVLVHLAMLVAVPVVLLMMSNGFKDVVRDSMWIDNTFDQTSTGPFVGEAMTEKKQYEDWKRTPEQLRQDCLEQDGLGENDCKPYISYTVSAFNCTNPDGVVLGTEKPKVQELGPLYFRIFRRVKNINETMWNSEGIAHFKENFTFELDTDLCDEACMSLLDASIIVPNPYWNFMVGQGMDSVFLLSTVIATLQMAPTATWDFIGNASFGLDVGHESKAFADAFLRAAPMSLSTNIIVFVTSTQAAISSGSAACMLGSQPLATAKCLLLQQGLTTMLTSTVWPGTQGLFSNQYGSAASMPVFVRATVREALGFKGAYIHDPLLEPMLASLGLPGLHFNGALDRETWAPPHQMASTFPGVTGIDYIQEYANPLSCGLYDADCDASCTETSTCTLSTVSGFTSKLPASVWASEGGFPEYSQAGQMATFVDSMTGVMLTLKSEGRRERSVGDTDLEYVKWKLTRLAAPRLENCAGDLALGSRGIDCDAPRGQISVPIMPGLYVGWAYFGEDYMDSTDFEAMHAGQLQIPYDPADRVTIHKCSGSTWCDSAHSGFRFESEPETGAVIALGISTQLSLRIGLRPTLLHPSGFNDTLLPVLALQVDAGASVAAQAKLAQFQKWPGSLFLYMILGIVYAAMQIGFSSACLAFALIKRRRAANPTNEVIVSGHEDGASLPSMLTSPSVVPEAKVSSEP